MSVTSLGSEVRMAVQSAVDELFDSVRDGTLSHSAASFKLRDILQNTENGLAALNKNYLRRAFILIGRKSEAPVKASTATEIKKSRELLNEILAAAVGGDNDGNGDKHADGNEENDMEEDSDYQSEPQTSSDSDRVEAKKPVRSSPRSPVKAGREKQVVKKVANGEKVEIKNMVRELYKQFEVQKLAGKSALQNSIDSIPLMNESKHVKKSSKSEEKNNKILNTSTNKKLKSKNNKNIDSDVYSSDYSSSSNSSSIKSSSSNSSSSSSDGNTKKRKYKQKSTIKRRAKQFIKDNCGDGVLNYLQRVIYAVRSNQSVKNDVTARDNRSIHEAEVLANALDAFIKDGTNAKLDGMEVLVTRLIGLIHAINNRGDFSVAIAIQFTVAGTNTLPLSSKEMAKLIKQGQRIKSLTSNSTSTQRNNRYNNNSGTSDNNNNNSSGTNGYNNYNNYNKNKKNNNNDNNNPSVIKAGTNNGTVPDKNGSKPT